jgi:hypothetical protein
LTPFDREVVIKNTRSGLVFFMTRTGIEPVTY